MATVLRWFQQFTGFIAIFSGLLAASSSANDPWPDNEGKHVSPKWSLCITHGHCEPDAFCLTRPGDGSQNDWYTCAPVVYDYKKAIQRRQYGLCGEPAGQGCVWWDAYYCAQIEVYRDNNLGECAEPRCKYWVYFEDACEVP